MTANQINFRKALETERSNRENERIKEISAKADESKAESARISADASRLSADASLLKAYADEYNAKYGKGFIGDLQRFVNNSSGTFGNHPTRDSRLLDLGSKSFEGGGNWQ